MSFSAFCDSPLLGIVECLELEGIEATLSLYEWRAASCRQDRVNGLVAVYFTACVEGVYEAGIERIFISGLEAPLIFVLGWDDRFSRGSL